MLLIFLLWLPLVCGLTQQNLSMTATETFEAIDLTQVDTLTFYKGQETTGRRSKPVPQLSCVGGDACSYASNVEVIQCTNQGTNDRNEVQWKCDCELDTKMKLGKVQVTCEGFKGTRHDLPYYPFLFPLYLPY